MNNKGINLEKELLEQSEKDWVFGSDIKATCLVSLKEEDRITYLPKGEIQRAREDMQDCVTRAFLNIIETKLNYLWKKGMLDNWFYENGYITPNGIELSDAFIAILSGTTRQGNSFKAVADAIRKNGLIPKKLLPLESWMLFDDYHNPNRITTQMRTLGLQFLNKLAINYEQVPKDQISEALKDDMVVVAGYAWGDYVNGVYQKSTRELNHSFMNMKNKYSIFDNYLDFDNDFIKQLAGDYIFFDWGYRIVLSIPPLKENISFLQTLINSIKKLIESLTSQLEIYELEVEKINQMNKLDVFCEAIKEYEGYYKPNENPKYPKGSLSYRNNNPGNCRCSPVGYKAIYGNVLCVNRFAKFETYEKGMLYLKNLVLNTAKSNPNWSIYDYFALKHAPSTDNNDPESYAEFVAKKCGVTKEAKLKDVVL
jgi:hypothetical protein